MFNELSLNFDLTHSLNLRYFYNCIPIQTDLCQEKIKFKSYMLWFCFCFFNTYKKQLHMKARLRKDKMCFSSSSKSCKKSLGSVLTGPGWEPPPSKSCEQNSYICNIFIVEKFANRYWYTSEVLHCTHSNIMLHAL